MRIPKQHLGDNLQRCGPENRLQSFDDLMLRVGIGVQTRALGLIVVKMAFPFRQNAKTVGLGAGKSSGFAEANFADGVCEMRSQGVAAPR
jgi:hypothetical protein